MPSFANVTAASYEPITVYDKPEVLAGMILDGEVTARGLRNLAFEPERLTLQERENVITRLKQQAGSNKLAGALIDTALNPFVWLAFALSPTGLNHLQKAGSFAGVGRLATTYINENKGFFRNLTGALSPLNVLPSDMSALANQIAGRTKSLVTGMGQEVAPAMARLTKSMGLSEGLGLDPTLYTDAAKAAEVAKVRSVIATEMEGLHLSRRVGNIVRGEDGSFSVIQSTLAPDVDAVAHARALGELTSKYDGLGDLIAGMKRVREEGRLRMFLNEGEYAKGNVVVDGNKVANVWRGLKNHVVTGRPGGQDALAYITHAIGADAAELVSSGRMTQEQFTDLLASNFEKLMPEHYFPHNLTQEVGRWGDRGRRVSYDVSAARAIGPTPSVIARTVNSPIHTYDFYKGLADTYGEANLSAAMRVQAQQSRSMTFDALGIAKDDPLRVLDDGIELATKRFKALDEAGKGVPGARPIRFLASNPIDQIRRYINDTARTVAVHIDTVGAEAAAARQQVEKALADAGETLTPGSQTFEPRFNQVYRNGKVIPDAERFTAGYRNVGDALEEAFLANHDPYVRDTLTELVVPTLMGSRTARQMGTTGTLLKIQDGFRAITRSDLFKGGLKYAGTHGEKFGQYLTELAEMPSDQFGNSIVHGLTSALYAGGLGLNPGAALINMMQPLTIAAARGGLGNVLYGYGKAIGEMAAYAADRVATYGARTLNSDERAALIHKHFKFSNFGGEDLIQIGERFADQLHASSFNQGVVLPEPGKFERVMGWTMKMFEKAEWMNRSVTAHAMEAAYRAKGLAVEGNPAFLSDARRFVADTQFVSNPLTAPIFFQTDNPRLAGRLGPILSNPIFRQYLSYPLRFFTSVVHDSARQYGALGGLKDFARGVGISALVYEMSKPWVGEGLTRGLYAAGATGLFPTTDDRSGPIPLPPIFDVPWKVMQDIAGDDRAALVKDLAIFIPGGIGGMKALGALGEYSPVSGLQKTVAMWSSPTPDGRIPIVETATGNLVDYRTPSEIVMRGLGLDFGAYNTGPQVDNFLVKQREEIVRYRAKWIRAVQTNDYSTAEGIQQEFKTRFGIPLTVTQQQMAGATKSQMTAKPQRILDRLPQEFRAAYTDYVSPVQQGRMEPPAPTPPTEMPAAPDRGGGQGFGGTGFSPFEGF